MIQNTLTTTTLTKEAKYLIEFFETHIMFPSSADLGTFSNEGSIKAKRRKPLLLSSLKVNMDLAELDEATYTNEVSSW